MNILPGKNHTPLSILNQLCLPMDAGVLIPPGRFGTAARLGLEAA
jgi:hypothetical protein